MRGRVTVKLNRFDELSDRLRREAEDAVAATAEQVRDVTARRTPEDQGELADSWEVADDGPGRKVVKSDVLHAGLVEYGTVHNPPSGAATSAAEEARGDFVKRMRRILR